MISSISWVPKGVSKPVIYMTKAMKDVLKEFYGDEDPYLSKDKNEYDYDYEELCNPIYPTDSLIVCARPKVEGSDSFGILEVLRLNPDIRHPASPFTHHEILISALPLCLAWLDCPLQGGERGNFLAVGSMKPNIGIFNIDVGMEGESHVQAVAWNLHSPRLLLSGSFDGTVFLKDGRMPSNDGCEWKLNAKVKSLAWDPHSEHSFVVSLANGTVRLIDVRTAKSDSGSEFNANEHGKAVTSVSYNPSAPNLLATGSEDETVKLWDLSHNQPSCVASYSPKVGPVFCISFSEEDPFFLAIGGSKGNLRIWNLHQDSGISQRYGNYMK
ncbi:Protein SPA1-RELATED 4 [Vigna angularis]|uniref:Protein SPA1-RELATED 4 n=1 Tax=Phaseolus angularis TaxID=3914 RepID=A0A8T0K6L0_PHAAN|nr:Protein SPA1-RELATED 4 [Vigna angularis]